MLPFTAAVMALREMESDMIGIEDIAEDDCGKVVDWKFTKDGDTFMFTWSDDPLDFVYQSREQVEKLHAVLTAALSAT